MNNYIKGMMHIPIFQEKNHIYYHMVICIKQIFQIQNIDQLIHLKLLIHYE